MTNHSLKFWDRIANRYSKNPVVDEEAYQNKLQITRNYFRPNMEVLEFGCGTGSTAILHSPYVKHIYAIDGSEKMISIARGKANAKNIKNINFELLTIDDLNAADQTYDVVMGHSILHLLKNRDDTILKVYKMLKPNGIFVSSTVCMGDSKKYFKIIAPIGTLFGLILKIFTSKELKDSMVEAGFKIDYEWIPPGKDKVLFIVAKK